MDGFNDAFNGTNGEEADPAAEFLAREQSNLAGLEDNFEAPTPVVLANGLDTKPERDELLASGENEIDSGFEMVNHSSFDASLATTVAATNGHSASENSFGQNNGTRLGSTSPLPSSFSDIPREEPEKIKRWREDQKKRLENKDVEEERKKKEMKEAARKELEEWYTSHEEQVAKNRTANRSAEKELVADTDPIEPGTEWERIAKLCDFNPKGSKHQKDISRMRSIILQVKQSPPAAATLSKK